MVLGWELKGDKPGLTESGVSDSSLEGAMHGDCLLGLTLLRHQIVAQFEAILEGGQGDRASADDWRLELCNSPILVWE
jgi:hypothetical protein